MRPLTFVNGVILGSTTALGGVSGVILFFRYVLMRDSSLDQAVVQSALPLSELGRNTLMFSGLAVLAGVAFWGQVAQRLWRWLAEIALVLGLAAVVIWLVAEPGNRDRDLVALGVIAFVVLALGVAGWRTGFFKLVSAWLGDE
ncbi:MAG: hypothetical protein KGL98_05880 [Gammaproteobacteria bacterium]|nr:hypothetical protein [Gammaproteobacteria bacterium]MBU6508606.1 hypothetical protein [Gammaproteobacteria bacterium]MDE1983093.1 hypothetical protein [Gammaproteobacteria bacterium]MDE2107582.1 hypothetical protein [Gammaproteobacteria bacterium]MDE2460759.1 hypothetical protein [Gammaproteobacteria bacterium]